MTSMTARGVSISLWAVRDVTDRPLQGKPISIPSRPLGRRFGTRARQRRPNSSARFGNEQSFNIRILINYPCAILEKTAGIGSRPVRAVEFVGKHTQISRELAAVMGGMGDAAHQNPGSAP